jgi:transcriptional regulatory protein LevR
MPRSDFTPRLALLEEAAQISSSARRLTGDFVDAFEARFELALGEANGAMLVTHVAMALTRVERGDSLEEPPRVVRDEVAERRTEYEWVEQELGASYRTLGVAVPSSEVVYVVAHVVSVLQAEQSDG